MKVKQLWFCVDHAEGGGVSGLWDFRAGATGGLVSAIVYTSYKYKVMTGTCAACLHTDQSRSYLNHFVLS
jgi:hypothetical protein